MFRYCAAIALLICGLSAVLVSCERSPFGPLQTISVNGETIRVEVADTADKRSLGLMYREKLPKNRGMLFLYEEPTTSGFWMKNTKIPLSIAFIDEDLRIIEIQEMRPLDLTPHRPERPYKYALETNRGWFREHGIGPGSTVQLHSR